MQFAVIGEIPDAAPLLAEIAAVEGHALVGASVRGHLRQQCESRNLSLPPDDAAEELAVADGIDAVIIAMADSQAALSLTRQASQYDRHVILFVPNDVSTAFSYELHLILDEASTGIVPVAGRWFCDYSAVAPDAVSRIRNMTLTLPLSDDAETQRRRQLDAIDAVYGLGFSFTQVTGLDIGLTDGRPEARTITLAVSGDVAQPSPPATIHFVRRPLPGAEFVVTTDDGSEICIPNSLHEPFSAARLPAGESGLNQLLRLLADRTGCQQQMESFSASLELLEALDKSLRRRRTVDVHFENLSERTVFKTQMTAIGCGVLTYMIFGLIAYLVIAQVARPPDAVLQIGRILWVAPLVLFLLAQLLLPVARTRSRSPVVSPDDSSSEAEKREDSSGE